MKKEKSFSPEQPKNRPNVPDIPETPPMPAAPKPVYSANHTAAVFNLWNLRYSEDPDSFDDSLDENGKPIEDYGEWGAFHFQKLSDEIWGA